MSQKKKLLFQFLMACVVLFPLAVLVLLLTNQIVCLELYPLFRALFGDMGSVGLFYALGISIAGGVFATLVLGIGKRYGRFAIPFLILQFFASAISLHALTHWMPLDLGLGGYLEPLVGGIALHCGLMTLAVLAGGKRHWVHAV